MYQKPHGSIRCTGTNAGSTLTFTAPENIVKIEFEGKAVAFKEVTNKVWTGDAKEAVLEATGKNQLSKCVVTYGEAPAPVEPETPVEPAGEGTLESPYNVAKALPLAEALDATGKVEGIYVKGYIVSIKEISTSYGNATYYIGDTPTSTTTLYVFRGKGLDGAKFTSESELVVGAEVVISGDLANYNGTSPQVNTVVTEYVVTGYDPNMTGVQTVTVTYQNKTCTFEVTVKTQTSENDEPYIEILSEPVFNGGSLTGIVSVRTHNVNESSKLILAVYDGEDIVKTVQVKDNDLSVGTVDFDELNITGISGCSYAVFVWNDMTNCKPLCKAYRRI